MGERASVGTGMSVVGLSAGWRLVVSGLAATSLAVVVGCSSATAPASQPAATQAALAPTVQAAAPTVVAIAASTVQAAAPTVQAVAPTVVAAAPTVQAVAPTVVAAAPTVVAVAAAAAPTALVAAPAPTAAGPAAVVKVGLVAGTGASPIFIAQGRGYFQKQGLDVQFVSVSSGSELLPLMASDQLDAGISSAGAALYNAIGNGVHLKAVGDAGRQSDGAWWAGIVVRPELLASGAIKSPADLKGRSIAVTAPGVGTYKTVIELLERNGLTEQDVNLVNLDFAGMVSALATGKIDAASMVEPAITQGEAQGILKRWISTEEVDPGDQGAVLMMTPKLVANRDVANRFMVAYVHAIQDYRGAYGPEKTDQAGVTQAVLPMLPSGFTADLVNKVSPLGLDPAGVVNGDSLKAQQDWYAAHGFIKTPVNIDDVVDNSLAEHARDTLANTAH